MSKPYGTETDEIEEWPLTEAHRKKNECNKDDNGKARITGHRMLRSNTGKDQHGKSTLGGKAILFNIHSRNGQEGKRCGGKKWSALTKKCLPEKP